MFRALERVGLLSSEISFTRDIAQGKCISFSLIVETDHDYILFKADWDSLEAPCTSYFFYQGQAREFSFSRGVAVCRNEPLKNQRL